jgi:FkbM family methyltransferase
MLQHLAGAILPPSVKRLIRRYLYDPPYEPWSRSYRAVPLRYAPRVRMDLVPGCLISEVIRSTGTWETDITHELCDLALDGGCLVEVGANIGYFALLWASAREDNRVFAFEPSLRNFDLLRHNILRNGLVRQIHPFSVAVSNSTCLGSFMEGPPEQTGNGTLTLSPTPSDPPVVVVPLDLLFPEANIDVLKIDVEGADTWVLFGCERLLRERRIHVIFYEQNKPRMQALGIDEDAASQFLNQMGYHTNLFTEYSADTTEWKAVPLDH